MSDKIKRLTDELKQLDEEKWAGIYILQVFHSQMALGYNQMGEQKKGKEFDKETKETLKHVAVLMEMHKKLLTRGHDRAKEIQAKIEQIKEDRVNVAADNPNKTPAKTNMGHTVLNDHVGQTIDGYDDKQKHDELALSGQQYAAMAQAAIERDGLEKIIESVDELVKADPTALPNIRKTLEGIRLADKGNRAELEKLKERMKPAGVKKDLNEAEMMLKVGKKKKSKKHIMGFDFLRAVKSISDTTGSL